LLALTILGSNSAIPAFGRNPTAQLLQTEECSFLIDCGEGTQTQLARYKLRNSKLSYIFISHLHGDHYFGLIGLLTSMSLLNRTQELHVYGPEPLGKIIEIQLEAGEVSLNYPLHFHPLKQEGIICQTGKMEIQCFKMQHRIECWGFLFKEIKNPRSVDTAKAKTYEIPLAFYEQLKRGENYIHKDGRIIQNAEVTTAAPKARSYAYCADTLYDENIANKIKGADLIYHESTYLKEEQQKAFQRYHSTTIQAANIAKIAETKQLIIGHFSSKYEKLEAFLAEAKEVFENTTLAVEGSCYKI
jgi:ribonuclease Z